jgi:hypothetical protein
MFQLIVCKPVILHNKFDGKNAKNILSAISDVIVLVCKIKVDGGFLQ